MQDSLAMLYLEEGFQVKALVAQLPASDCVVGAGIIP